MYRIIKVLNNNGILVLDGDTGRELILLGNGIGFGHRTGERLEQVKEAKRYELVTGKSTALQQVNSIDPVFIEAAGNIIESARKTLGDISSDILIYPWRTISPWPQAGPGKEGSFQIPLTRISKPCLTGNTRQPWKAGKSYGK